MIRGSAARARARAALVLTVLVVAALAGPRSAAAELEAPDRSDVAVLPAAGLVPTGIDATNFVLVDVPSGQVLLARAEDERRPVASTIKVLTALTAIERLDARSTITVGDEVLGVGGSEVGLAPGATWSVEDLLEALLVRSGNEAAEAMAVAASGDRARFVDAMREDAATLGLEGATITEPSGLEDGNLLSAMDLSVLGRSALAHPVLAPIIGRPRVELPGLGSVENRNLLVGSYPGASGVKTGFTSAAGNVIIASASREGRELLVVLLGSGPDPARFRDAARLLDVGFEAFEEVSPLVAYELASGAGWWSTEPVGRSSLLVPIGAEVGVEVEPPSLIVGGTTRAHVIVDAQEAVELRLSMRAPGIRGDRQGASASARLAAGVADGVFAGLRAAVAVDGLG